MINEEFIINNFIGKWYEHSFENYLVNDFLDEFNIDNSLFTTFFKDETEILFTINVIMVKKLTSILDQIIASECSPSQKIKNYLKELELLSKSHYKEIFVITEVVPKITDLYRDNQLNSLRELNNELSQKQMKISSDFQHNGCAKKLDPLTISRLFMSVLVSESRFNFTKTKEGFTFESLEEYLFSSYV